MMPTLQMTVTTGLFAVLGAALAYRSHGLTGRASNFTRLQVWLRTVSGAVATSGAWVLLQFGRELMPERWARLVPWVLLSSLVLGSLWKPSQVTDAERQSAGRIQFGILIGGVSLVAFLMILYWSR